MSKEDKINQIKKTLTKCKDLIETTEFAINFTISPKYIDIDTEIKMDAFEKTSAKAYRKKEGTEDKWEKHLPNTAYVIHEKIQKVLRNPEITVRELDKTLFDICKEVKSKTRVYGPGLIGTTGSTAQIYDQICQLANKARENINLYMEPEQSGIGLTTIGTGSTN